MNCFASPFEFEIAAGTPLVIMACSATKRDVAGLVRFTDLYDGPLWRQLRCAGYPVTNIAAISALHGFLDPGRQIESYNIEMDEKRSARICSQSDHVARLIRATKIAGRAIVFGGALYRAVATTAQRREPSLDIAQASGSFLAQRKQLGEFLRATKGVG